MALKTSFMISCGFDCDRMPKCHLAFFVGFLTSLSTGFCSIVSKVAVTSFNSIKYHIIKQLFLYFTQFYISSFTRHSFRMLFIFRCVRLLLLKSITNCYSNLIIFCLNSINRTILYIFDLIVFSIKLAFNKSTVLPV